MEDDDELRSYFSGRLPHRLDEIARAGDGARGARWAGQPLRDFHRLVHSLAGAGATFGFPEVSERAGLLERRLKVLLGTGAPPPAAEEIQGIEGRLASLLELYPAVPHSGSGSSK